MLVPPHRSKSSQVTAIFRHLGAFGLFLLAIVDSLPLPTLAGPDILTAILAASHRHPWYECAGAATAGSVIGAYITFRLARKMGAAKLHSRFGQGKIASFLRLFDRWGTGALVVTTAVPLPFPTSAFFAAAGASDYPLSKYLVVVTVCRAARYGGIAIGADYVGRRFVHVVRHPGQYWGWLLGIAALLIAIFGASILVRKRIERSYLESEGPAA